jgi:hypothetical protein
MSKDAPAIRSHGCAAAIPLGLDFLATEKGNTLLTSSDGNLVAWISLADGVWLEISDTPGNSPRFFVAVRNTTAAELREHVLANLSGWIVQRWNLDSNPPVDADGWVVEPANLQPAGA